MEKMDDTASGSDVYNFVTPWKPIDAVVKTSCGSLPLVV